MLSAQCNLHNNAQCLHSAQCIQVTFGLSLSSSLHLLSQLRKPVGYEESCVDEPANTVVQAGFLPAGKAAAWGPHTQGGNLLEHSCSSRFPPCWKGCCLGSPH